MAIPSNVPLNLKRSLLRKRNEIERSPTQQTTFQHFRFKQTSVQFKLLI
ncbi:MAG: hypothetical protein ACTS6P_01255 [Candidatus Hodgkinia cicadicola]